MLPRENSKSDKDYRRADSGESELGVRYYDSVRNTRIHPRNVPRPEWCGVRTTTVEQRPRDTPVPLRRRYFGKGPEDGCDRRTKPERTTVTLGRPSDAEYDRRNKGTTDGKGRVGVRNGIFPDLGRKSGEGTPCPSRIWSTVRCLGNSPEV